MEKKRVLIVAQEVCPYLPSSEMSEQTRNLLLKLQEKGCEPRTFMPRYGVVNERRNQLHEVQRLSGVNIIIDDTDHPLIIKVASMPSTRIQVFFLVNEDYFLQRGVMADKDGNEYADNDERAIFMARGVIETVRKMGWVPDVIHCHGSLTALTPLYLKKNYSDDPIFRDTKIVYSDYAKEFTTPWSSRLIEKISMDGIDISDLGVDSNTEFTHNEVLKLATKYSDAIASASENSDASIGEYAASLDKIYLPYQKEDMIEEYINLYEKISL
ncbi:MAG: glycogen/starch synthase [Bacteroidales bacterium]|nr:glycogen/starch synthase [Bacteroidales bacterium]